MNGKIQRLSAPTDTRFRVLVVDDSELQRTVLATLLDADPELTVVGRAGDGPEAIRYAATLHPDVITIDLRMPGMDGIEASRRIMQETPTPIVVVAAGISPEDRRLASEALAAGALALVPKPSAGRNGERAAAELVATVKRMAQVRVIRRWTPERVATGQLRLPAAPARGTSGLLKQPRPGAAPATHLPEIVVIGASTGGPQALQAILPRLPASFAPPVVIVQHIAAGFAASIVDWLAPQCALPLQLAQAGQVLDHPGIYLAPTGRHLLVQGRTLALSDEPPLRGHRPSATFLFNSVAASYGPHAIGVLLTGMGDDGAAGLVALRDAGATTIAQDEASSVVFGMPGVAIALGAAGHILSPMQIPDLLIRLASGNQERRPRTLLPSRGPLAGS